MRRASRLAVVTMLLACASSRGGRPHPDGGWVELPARFTRDRIFVTPTTADGSPVTMFLDTGANMSFVLSTTVARLGLHDSAGPDGSAIAVLPALRGGTPSSGRLVVTPPQGEARMLVLDSADGMLGRRWFAGRAWRIDYPGRRLWVGPSDGAACRAAAHCIPLGFQRDSSGMQTFEFPRVRISVAGDSVDLLLDLGATTLPTPEALAVLGGPAGLRATSFVKDAVFERWRTAHTAWRVLRRADQVSRQDMIEVPWIEIAGLRSGPVWFTRRPDAAIDQTIARMTDVPVVGALGGSGLRYFVVTLDYPGARASFAPSTSPP